MFLTEAGRDYLPVIRDAFDRTPSAPIDCCCVGRAVFSPSALRPTSPPSGSFNRLSRRGEKHPGVDLRVSATTHYVDFARDDVDIAIRHGDGNWPGLDVQRLYSERLFPVCSPRLVAGRNRSSKTLGLSKFPLLRLEDAKNWTRLFAAPGVKAEIGPGPVLNGASILIDAAIDGQGIGLARTALAAWNLINGRLARPVDVFAAEGQYLLDSLPQSSIKRAEDCDAPQFGPRRSGRR